MLKVRNLEAGYGKLRVLKRISMHVDAGEIVTIIGANGAGKSTLLHTITGLVKIGTGEIVFKKKNLQKVSPEKIVASGCSLVPEGRQVFSTMTVQENLILGGYVQAKRDRSNVDSEMGRVYELFPVLIKTSGGGIYSAGSDFGDKSPPGCRKQGRWSRAPVY